MLITNAAVEEIQLERQDIRVTARNFKRKAGRPTETGPAIECKQCKGLFGRYPVDKKTYKRTLYVCDQGKHWSGRVCPTCHNSNRANNYEPSLASRGRSPVVYIRRGTKTRPCGSCGEKTVNYFRCKKCLYQAAQDSDSFRFAEINGEVV